MRTALAYLPRRGPLQDAAAGPAIAFTSSFALVAFCFSNPIILFAAGLGAAVAGIAARAGRAVMASLAWGLPLATLIVAVNALVTDRGDTVLARGPEVPLLGDVNVTLESVAAGGVIAMRIVVVMIAFAVFSACVDPDRVLRLVRPIARRSALTTTLVTRMVPLAARDAGRISEAAALRGPEAEPVGRGELVRRLIAGALDRSVDAAATLELRGYAIDTRTVPRRHRSRRDGRFLAAGVAVAIGGVVARLAGVGDFGAYPSLVVATDPATIGFAAALPVLAMAPFVGAGLRPRGRPVPRTRSAHA